ncbi:PEP-utilizing enzyme [[Mycobacterium] crassicus]|uniref:PEP-utilizing enzyme n=1 Tax=[Mycobacterium] crassicus TaxID=2872309 RepID=A0ABU5XIK3_9MYCO|nr:PEP-utilizing enzyme [Mycolicibacter sp. MYC098]MEB3022110.1 PEP-utilizing enzyme [Mycolicibacter sp. MYC098]
MATVVPIDEFVADAGYPGSPDRTEDSAPQLIEPYSRFRPEDQSRFWFLDFHWPRGLTPMGLISMTDGYAWATQYAAQAVSLPSGRGITVRSAGTHTYAAEIPLDPTVDKADRLARFARLLPPFIRDFKQVWHDYRTEIEADWQRLRDVDLARLPRAELGNFLRRARAQHKRTWEIHFELMYLLLAHYLGFRGMCTELGIDPVEISKFLECGETRIMATDRELWRLAAAARDAGLGSIFAATEPEELAVTLTKAGGKATGWLTGFRSFLDTYGWRTEGIGDIALPSWVEDPTSPLGTIKTLLHKDADHDFSAARTAARDASDGAIDAARSKLTREEQAAFDAGLASCQAANFAWWNEEHDFYIDLRATLPMRWGCLAAAEAIGTDEPDDTLFLFWPELMSILDGAADFREFKSIIGDRRQYFDHWSERRATMPKVLGTMPDTVSDPVMIEIFGINKHFLHAVRAAGSGASVKTLTGVPAARGSARGPARVLSNADHLHRILPGEVLVCESTSPNWTPAFAKIAACICDAGGSLSHAAIVGREYGVPTVTAVGVGTELIRDGDEVEVDGSTGTVTIFRRNDGSASSGST